MKSRPHITLLGPADRLQVWEERTRRLLNPSQLILTSDQEAIPPETSVCIFIAETEEERLQLGSLIKRGLNVLVIDQPAFYLDQAEELWSLAEESGAEIWISLWNLFQPGITRLYERIPKPNHLLFSRNLQSGHFHNQQKFKITLIEELLLVQYWLGQPIKKSRESSTVDSYLMHLETPDGKLASVHLACSENTDSSDRLISGSSCGSYHFGSHLSEAYIYSAGQKISLHPDTPVSGADILLVSFFRAINGLSHRPSFKIFDLYRFRDTNRYLSFQNTK